jgi:hypothetical protein
MLKNFKKVGFLLFTAGCTPLENFVDSKITVTKTSSLNPSIIEKFSNEIKQLDLFGIHEIAKSPTQSIIQNDKGDFFLISNPQGKNNFFNMEKISLQDEKEKVNSFFFLNNKLYALGLEGNTINIYECSKENFDGEVEELPSIKYRYDFVASFNAASDENLNPDFRKKIQNNIWRQRATENEEYSSLDTKKLDFYFLGNVHCCSECVIGNKSSVQKGCFILVQTKVQNDGGEDFANINLGLFFDGDTIIPCQELASDNSFLYGNFNKFSITSLKTCGDTIVARCKELKDENKSDFSDFVAVGKLVLDVEGDVCYKLISSHFVENLKDITFLKTENDTPIITTIFVDNSNRVKFGTLVDTEFRSQSAPEIVGIDFFKTNAGLPIRTRLRDYNLSFIGDNGVLAQYYKTPDDLDHSTDYLITFNEVRISKVF